MMQAQLFMRKGDMPMPNVSFTILLLNLYVPRLKWMSSSGLLNTCSCHSNEMICARMVAVAEPRMPMSSP